MMTFLGAYAIATTLGCIACAVILKWGDSIARKWRKRVQIDFETDYLLRSPANAERLRRAIASLDGAAK